MAKRSNEKRTPRHAATAGRRPSPTRGWSARGFTLLEILLALAIGAILIGSVSGVVRHTLDAWAATRERNQLAREARFAMDRMLRAVQATSRLILPLGENPATAYSESVRDVLAVTLDPTLDRDGDGVADADNDGDGLVDEDVDRDNNADDQSGVAGVDDDNDGEVDESSKEDDDEDEDDLGAKNEEVLDGIDNDGDGAIDEDLNHDMSGDGESGLAGVDDDGDGDIDESSHEDDDEDEDDAGGKNEDWFDTVVYRLDGATLLERLPNLGAADGREFSEHPIAENVSQFRVERLANVGDRAVLVDITLELTGSSGVAVALDSRVRVGAQR